MRSGSLSLVLVLVLVLGPGCATVVLGPGTAETNADLGLFNTLQSRRPMDIGFGPHSGFSLSTQEALARAIDIVVSRIDMTDVSSRTVYIPGFSGPRRPEVARRVDAAYVACRLAERVIGAHGRIAFHRADADFVLFPWVQLAGGITTHRESRDPFYNLIVYTHEESQAPARLAVFLYDKRRKRLELLEVDRTWQVKIDSYILGIFPIEWFLGF